MRPIIKRKIRLRAGARLCDVFRGRLNVRFDSDVYYSFPERLSHS